MSKKWGKWIFPLLATLLLAPWPVAYAYSYDANAMGGQDAVRIEVAEPSVAPSWYAFGRAIGGVTTPGDLFYIDATENAADITVTLYLTNTHELSYCYSYLILEVGVYTESNAGKWEKTPWDDGKLIPEIFITLRNGQVSFTLPGHAKHKVTIDSGSFYCVNASVDGVSLSPQFYLTVD